PPPRPSVLESPSVLEPEAYEQPQAYEQAPLGEQIPGSDPPPVEQSRSVHLGQAESRESPAPGLLDGPKPDRAGLSAPGPTGGGPAVHLNPNSTIISDSTLRLNVAGQDYSFLPGAEVTVGRDPSCLVQLDERHSLVSRRHLRITFEDDAWWLEDFSSKGTFVNNKQLKKPYKAEGAFIANLGDDDAGTPMRVITAGEHRVPRNRNMLAILGLAAAALIPLAILAVLLTRDDSPSSTEPDFVAAKQSTVMLFGLEGGQGSGFFVSDNLILTNQHVAVLSPQMLVGVSRQADEPAQIEYATELVANHPFLDLAVLRISNRATLTGDGPQISPEPVGSINLPSVAVGDSTSVTIGDRVFNTGFPGRLSITSADDAGDLRLPSVVATSGEAANFAIWPGCSNPDFDLFIPSDSPPGVACSAGGDLKNGVLLSSFFSSGQGASGSAVFHDNEVVAVVYAGAADEDNATLSITSSVFAEWLEEIIEQNP
ncbi:MAG: FHA domain-containing protein, partial [Acidimicrobiales bacterium]